MVGWYWAGDSGKNGGTQDKWIKPTHFDNTNIAFELEQAYNNKRKKKFKLDDERYVDLSDRDDMLQRRYDDPDKRRKVKRVEDGDDEEKSEEESEEEAEVKWYWAGDPQAKTQNKQKTWVEYDAKTAEKLEKAFTKTPKNKRVKIDDERFVDFSEKDDDIFAQRRYDDESKMRYVKREEQSSSGPVKKKQKTSSTNNNNNNNNNNTTTTTTTTTTTSGGRRKRDEFMNQLSEFEKQELNMALDPRLSAFYTENVGLNEEIVEDNKNKNVNRDRHNNPKGEEYDLGRDGSFKGYSILIGKFLGLNLASPVGALKKKGFSVKEVTSEKEFIKGLKKADIAWVMSGTDEDGGAKRKTSSHERHPAWKTCTKKEFQNAVMEFHNDGGALMLWADNDPLFEHANAVLPLIMKDPKVVLCGNTPGSKIMSAGSASTKLEFGRHIITSGILKLYEGTTICYPEKVGKMKVLATSSDNHPVICYVDHEVLDPNCGRVIVDTGYTKNYISWDEAGTARYVVNANVWLLGLERKLMTGDELTARAKRK